MGKPTGFLEFNRIESKAVEPKTRIKNFDEFHTPLPLASQKEQAARCMDCGIPFCQSGLVIKGMVSGCPCNNLIPEWNELLYRGNYKRAYNRLIKTINFPEFTSRVCPAPCEKSCTCGLNGDPVCIKENERTIIEYAYEHGYAGPKPPQIRTEKKVAVIGSGPAGLAAADLLNMRGHEVTVFERSDRVGGLLMYGIPNMKLEKHIVDRKIKVMEDEGITFLTNANVGEDVKVSSVLKEFDAVVLACGASNPRDINAPGRDAKGIHFAVEYLTGVTKSLLDSKLTNKSFLNTKGKNVVVIGGGDTGNDCVGTSIRLGCKSVTQLEMMPKPPENRTDDNPWPQWPKTLKTDYGQEEAIDKFGNDPRIYETTVKEFVKDKDGKLSKLVCVKVKFTKNEKTGRMDLGFVEGSEFELPCDYVFIAAGFLGTQKYVTDAFGLELDNRTNVKTEQGKFATNIEKVFVTGDMHIGQSLVVRAIKQGREVARDVDVFLMGYSNLE